MQNARSKYHTKQREDLLTFITSAPDGHFTVNDICEYFRSAGNPIGTATVYRHLEKMVAEGIVTKYITGNNSPACFEYNDGSKDSNPSCYHCKCEQCGALIHMHCDELNTIAAHLLKDHSFHLNTKRTVFYGICENCASENIHKETGND